MRHCPRGCPEPGAPCTLPQSCHIWEPQAPGCRVARGSPCPSASIQGACGPGPLMAVFFPGGEDGSGDDSMVSLDPAAVLVPTRVNPYSVIDITPFREEQPPSPDPEAEDGDTSLHIPSGYSIPVPCGYAVPSSLPVLLPAYSSPIIVHAASLDEEGSGLGLSEPVGQASAASGVCRVLGGEERAVAWSRASPDSCGKA